MSNILTLPAHVITVDMDQCLSEPMREYWQRFPNATVHADVFYLEWGHADCDDVLIVVSEEFHTTGAEWVIGVYPKNGDTYLDNAVWMCHIQDERVAVGTLHFLIEVL